jgi:hypothetical protein
VSELKQEVVLEELAQLTNLVAPTNNGRGAVGFGECLHVISTIDVPTVRVDLLDPDPFFTRWLRPCNAGRSVPLRGHSSVPPGVAFGPCSDRCIYTHAAIRPRGVTRRWLERR